MGSSVSINTICSLITASSEVVDVVKESVKLSSSPHNTADLSIIRIGIRVLELIAGGCEMVAKCLGASNDTLLSIKQAEKAVRIVDVPFSIVKELNGSPESGSEVFEAIEGVLTPLISFSRAKNEAQIYEEKNNLPTSQKETVKTLAASTSAENLKKLEKEGTFIKLAEAVFKVGVLSKPAQIMEDATQLLNETQNLIAFLEKIHTHSVEVNANMRFNLRALPFIPVPLHKDIFFKRFVCPITMEPIRDPVGDPNGHQVFERRAAEEWLRRGHRTSPITRGELTRFVEKPHLKAAIDERLRFHEERIREHIQLGLHLPTNPVPQAAPAA